MRVWITLICSVCALCFSGASAQSPQTQPQDHGSGGSQTTIAAYPPPLTVVVPEKYGAAQGAEHQLACADPNSNLCQQARMAIGNEQLVTLTKAETAFLVLTFFGVIALGVLGLLRTRAQWRAGSDHRNTN